jgi:glycine/D-amino acid oxidase-like deaminating enzyme
MKPEAQQTESVWQTTHSVPEYPKLSENITTDVCVVGAGIAGMTTAYLLARAGKRVVVVDDGLIGSGETGHTTAHITAALDDRYYAIESMHGVEGARLAAESHLAALNRAEAIVRQENIDCDFEIVDGYLFAPDNESEEKHVKEFQEELAACSRAGLSDVQLVQRVPLDFWDTGLALKFPRQAQFHSLKFLTGLAQAIERDGGRIFNHSHVTEVKGGSPATIKTADEFTVSAGAVIVCTNASISDYVITHAKQAPYRTFVISARVPKNSVPYGLYWDNADPYHYVRLQPAEDDTFDYLIVGGEDHKTGHKDDADERFQHLIEWTRGKFPMADVFEHRWSGQVMEPFDYLSFTGRTPDGSENVYMHSGDSGNGITHGIMAGILLTDLVMKRDNPWAQVYDPKRVTLRSAREFLRENVDVAIQFRDYVRPPEVEEVAQIPPGEGAVIKRGKQRIAAYRDQEGVLIELSAVCTHLRCIVHWNSLEKSWDCPCHGSRFTPAGEVLNGPAISPLEKVQ